MKFRAFIATKCPFEISVNRLAHCDPWSDPEARKRRVVVVIAGQARNVRHCRVEAAPLPGNRAHAHIEVWIEGYKPSDFPTKQAVMDAEELWSLHVGICMELARIANELPRPQIH